MGLKDCQSWELERVSWKDRRGWSSSSMLEIEVMGRGGGAGNEYDRSAAVDCLGGKATCWCPQPIANH